MAKKEEVMTNTVKLTVRLAPGRLPRAGEEPASQPQTGGRRSLSGGFCTKEPDSYREKIPVTISLYVGEIRSEVKYPVLRRFVVLPWLAGRRAAAVIDGRHQVVEFPATPTAATGTHLGPAKCNVPF